MCKSGNIKNDNNEYVFILEDFTLYIKLIRSNELPDGVIAFPHYIKNENGFIKGITDNGEYIYFAVGNEDVVVNYKFVSAKIHFYIILKKGFTFDDKINVIRFVGGTLNQFGRLYTLKWPIEDISEENYFKVRYEKKIEKIFNIKNNIIQGKCIFKGDKTGYLSIEDGINISEDDASLYIETSVTQKNIIKIFRYISNIFKFFTFRNNIGEFHIELMMKDDKKKYNKVGECYYKDEEYYKSNKRNNNCIQMRMFNEKQLELLFDLLFVDEANEDKNSKVFSFDFIPNDKQSNLVSKNIVKDTITAFECVERLIEVKYDNDAKFDELKKKINDIFDIETNLSFDDKEMCKKYINNLGKKDKLPIKKRINFQCNQYKKYLDWFYEEWKIKADDLNEMIEKLVKYRNMHTHNDIGILDQELYIITKMLQILIYCMILKKINIDDQNLTYILQNCIC